MLHATFTISIKLHAFGSCALTVQYAASVETIRCMLGMTCKHSEARCRKDARRVCAGGLAGGQISQLVLVGCVGAR